MREMNTFFEKIASLPMMPKIIQEVILLLEDDEVNVNAVINRISLDQVLSAKVLRLSNSAYFGLSGSVSSLDKAISITGLSNLKTLVIASGITAAFTKIEGINLKQFWRHSFITANIAREISKERKVNTESTYIAALMHSIGQLPIFMVYPNEAAEIESLTQNSDFAVRQMIEKDKLGVDHGTIGAELAKKWNFPEEIQYAIKHYAHPLESELVQPAIIYLAAHLAKHLEAAVDVKTIAQSIPDQIAEYFAIDTNTYHEQIAAYQPLMLEADLI